MQPTPIIRPLSNADRDAAAALILPIQQGEFNVPITLADQPDLLDIEAAYFRPGGHFWGAFVDNQLAGTIGLLAPTATNAPTRETSAPSAPHFGVIRKMFVKQQYRGKPLSIAQHLVDTLITHAQHAGMQHLYLGTIHHMHAAHHFYEKNGFKKIPKTDLPQTFPLMPVDDTFYQLSL